MVTLNIDGSVITVEDGTTVLEAAKQIGIHIPTLCYDKRLMPYGASFFCAVEVKTNGREMLAPACVTTVAEGMEVTTHSPKVVETRRTQLMLILASHPLACPTCAAAGNCRLQDLVREYEVGEVIFSRDNREYHVDNRSHFIRINMDVCIKCGLCVRICDEVQGQGEISFVKRGTELDVCTYFGKPLECEFCGNCAQICPVGAISSKWLGGTGREFELSRTHTVCSFCSLGCAVTLCAKNEKIVKATAPENAPNEGMLCVKGRYGWPYIYSEERLTRPLIRQNGSLREVQWDEALQFVADGFLRTKRDFTPMSLAALGSARLTNEEAYVFNRFVRTVLGTPHLDHAGGHAYRPLTDALGPALGYPASTNSVREIRNAELILLLGADLTESHPVAKNEVIMATGPLRNGRVVVVDSVRTKLCERSGIALLTRPGAEHLVAYAMLREIIYNGRCDPDALRGIEEGFEDLLASLKEYSPDDVAKLTGASPDAIRQAALEYAEAGRATIILTTGMNGSGNHVALAQAAAALALVTGRIGKKSCGIHVFGEKANSQGAIDMGLAPELLPGFQSLVDEGALRKFETAWGSPLPREKALDARKILQQAENREIRCLYVVGENPVETYPDRRQTQRALANLDFLVVQDLFLSSTAGMAHAVLPAASFAEKTGTYTSAERRVHLLRPVINLTGPKSDLEIFQALASRMGNHLKYEKPEHVMEEIAKLVDEYKGISYERLDDYGVQWPCREIGHPGTAVLYETGFPQGKAGVTPAQPIRDDAGEEFPFHVIPRVVKFHSGSTSQWSRSLMTVCPEQWAEMNPDDMIALGIGNGDRIKIGSSTGESIRTRAKESVRALEGSVIVPDHFPALKLNHIRSWDQPFPRCRVDRL